MGCAQALNIRSENKIWKSDVEIRSRIICPDPAGRDLARPTGSLTHQSTLTHLHMSSRLNFPKDDNLATVESTTTTCAGVRKSVALDFVLAIQSLQRKLFPCLNLK